MEYYVGFIQSSNFLLYSKAVIILGILPLGIMGKLVDTFHNVLHLLLMQIDDHDFNYSDLLLYERMSSI